MQYSGKKTACISFPLGGIGSGCIGLGGNGRFLDVELDNAPNKDSNGAFTHFAVKAEREGRIVDARVLMGDLQPPYIGHTDRPLYTGFGFGPDRGSMAGMPHFERCVFTGEFPVARLDFSDRHFPGAVRLTAFNPFIPTNADDSSLPAAFFTVRLENDTAEPLTYTVAFSACNFFAKNSGIHRLRREGEQTYLVLSNPEKEGSFDRGDLTLATDADDCCGQEYWFRGNWFDSLSVFWQDFTAPWPLRERRYETNAETVNVMACGDYGTLAARIRLAPGESRELRFLLAWSKPWRSNTWEISAPGLTGEQIAGIRAQHWKNYYATRFPTSLDTARYALQEFGRLRRETELFCSALFGSSLPLEVLDAVSANLAVLKSPTCMRLEDGSFYAFEGVHAHEGSCEGTCTHVWSYAYALAHLFPSLERSARTLEYRYSMHENGSMGFRVQLPVGRPATDFRACADGQFGCVLRVWREYQLSGDREWLAGIWDAVKKSIRFAWSPENPDRWDENRDGLMEGRQHHTLDMELFGENAWLSGLYLAGLRAGTELAHAMGDRSAELEFDRIFRRGRKRLNRELWNGSWFIQKLDLHDQARLRAFDTGASLQGQNAVDAYWNDETGEIKYQIAGGCGIDQVLGQWHADLLGLGRVFDRSKTRSALRAIYQNNYIPVLREHVNPCRIYGLNDESGTIICSYPAGTARPAIPIAYAEETMHGFEYAAAGQMLLNGMEQQGRKLVRAVRSRYDGERRNPWNEMECGSNYARSLASYGLLLAYSGYRCSAAEGEVTFAPLKNRNGSWFFSQDSGFGVVRYDRDRVTLRLLYGTLTLRVLQLHRPCSQEVRKNGSPLAAAVSDGRVDFRSPCVLHAGDELGISLSFSIIAHTQKYDG